MPDVRVVKVRAIRLKGRHLRSSGIDTVVPRSFRFAVAGMRTRGFATLPTLSFFFFPLSLIPSISFSFSFALFLCNHSDRSITLLLCRCRLRSIAAARKRASSIVTRGSTTWVIDPSITTHPVTKGRPIGMIGTRGGNLSVPRNIPVSFRGGVIARTKEYRSCN